MTRIYCRGELVAVQNVGGWLVCDGCGKQLYPASSTFALTHGGIPSGHGNQDTQDHGPQADDSEADPQGRRAGAVSSGAAEVGGA